MEALEDDALEPGRKMGVDVGGRRQGLALTTEDDGGHAGLVVEGQVKGAELVENQAGLVDVGARVAALPLELLGRAVAHGAEEAPLLGELLEGTHVPGETEVEQMEIERLVEEKVGRLDVPMIDPHGVSGGEPLGQIVADLDDLLDGEELPLFLPCRDDAIQGTTAHELHGEPRRLPVEIRVQDTHDEGMVEQGEEPGFADEALQGGTSLVAEHLDGHLGLAGTSAEEDLPHSPGAEALADLVGADARGKLGTVPAG